MPVCVPEPPFTTASERQVWKLLREQLRPQDVLYANLRITDDRMDHEVDLVAVLPGAGLVVVEIKGGEVWHDGESWWQRRGGQPVPIHPVDQARNAKYALRRYVESDPRWRARHRGRFRWAHAVVLPQTAIAEDFALPDCPRWCVSGREDLDDLAGRLWDIPVRQESANRVADEDDAEALAEILRGRGLPQRDVVALAAEREQITEQLTHEQAAILDATKLLRRVEVRGGAGSGKTWLALEQTRRLARSGERVALTCYSRGLAEYLRRSVATWPRKQRPAYVGEFHALAFMPLTPMPMQLLGGDGPAVRLVACATADAVGRADDEVEALLADGWRPQDVALLTTGSRHPEQIARQAAGQDAYWRTFWDDDQVFYGHVLGFKGMERRAVVLALNESQPRERSRERLYVGLSRARDQLVVVGDPDHIRAVGGEDVLAGIRRTGND